MGRQGRGVAQPPREIMNIGGEMRIATPVTLVTDSQWTHCKKCCAGSVPGCQVTPLLREYVTKSAGGRGTRGPYGVSSEVWYGGTMGIVPMRYFTGRGACALRRGEGHPPTGSKETGVKDRR